MIHLDFSYEFDFSLYGISCHEKEYRFCWFLNKQLGLNMECEDDHVVFFKKVESSHSLYSGFDTESESNFELLRNKSETGWLIPELRQVDYLLKVRSEMGMSESKLSKKIRSIPNVIACFVLDPETLASGENLITDD